MDSGASDFGQVLIFLYSVLGVILLMFMCLYAYSAYDGSKRHKKQVMDDTSSVGKSSDEN